jgi:hypothetical protein
LVVSHRSLFIKSLPPHFQTFQSLYSSSVAASSPPTFCTTRCCPLVDHCLSHSYGLRLAPRRRQHFPDTRRARVTQSSSSSSNYKSCRSRTSCRPST